jgi:hypothetical protein
MTRDEKNYKRKRKKNTRGWYSNKEQKLNLLQEYNTALSLSVKDPSDKRSFINRHEKSLREAETYIFFKDGSCGPASSDGDEGGARACHGDTVIADAMVCLAKKEFHSSYTRIERETEKSMCYRTDTLSGRRKIREQNKKQRSERWLI